MHRQKWRLQASVSITSAVAMYQIIYKHYHAAWQHIHDQKMIWHSVQKFPSGCLPNFILNAHTLRAQVRWTPVTKPLPRYYELQPKKYSGWIYFCHWIMEHQQLVKHILFYNQVQFKQNGKTNTQNSISACCFIWVWTSVSHMMGCTQAAGVHNKILRQISWEKQKLVTGGRRNEQQIIYIPHFILLGWPNQGQWDGQGMNTYGWEEKCPQCFGGEVWMKETTCKI